MIGRRGWTLVAVVAALVIGTLLLAPQYVARWLIGAELDARGIEHDGLGTLDINVWKGEIWLGPVELRSPAAEPARLRRLGATLSWSSLAERRVYIDEFILEGLDLSLSRDGDGTLRISGIALPAGEPPTDPAAEDDTGPAPLFDLGLGDIRFREIRVNVGTSLLPLDQPLAIALDDVTVSQFKSWARYEPGRLSAAGRIGGIPFNLDGTVAPFATDILVIANAEIPRVDLSELRELLPEATLPSSQGRIRARSKSDIVLHKDGAVGGSATISVAFDDLAVDTNGTGRVAASSLSVSGNTVAAVSSEGLVNAKGSVELAADGLRLAGEDGSELDLDAITVAAAGVSLVYDTAEGDADSLTLFYGPIDAGRFAALPPLPYARYPSQLARRNSFTVELQGLAARPPTGESIAVERTTASLDHLEVNLAPGGRVRLSTAGRAALSGVIGERAEGGGVPAARLALEDVEFTLTEVTGVFGETGVPPVLQGKADISARKLGFRLAGGDIARLDAQEISLSGASLLKDRSVHAEALVLTGLDLAADHRVLTAAPAAAPPAGGGLNGTATGETTAGQNDVPAPRIVLDRLQIAPGSHLAFTDGTRSPPVKVDAMIERFVVTGLDSGAPDNALTIDVAARVNEFAEVTLDGTATALAARPSFDVRAALSELQLSAFSPYVEGLVGLYLESGTLSSQTSARATGAGTLDANVSINLSALEFEPLSPEDAARLSEEVGGVPVETAVALLQDSSGNINLEIPVSGDLDNPQFNFQQVIGRAISGAIKATITTTLKAVFPPALLISALSDGNGGIQFKPIVFTPLGDDVSETGMTLVSSMATLLGERPKLSVKVCGTATAADFDAAMRELAVERLEEGAEEDAIAELTTSLRNDPAAVESARTRLQGLAVARGRSVRRAMIDGEGVAAERIGECRSTFEPDDSGPPRATIGF